MSCLTGFSKCSPQLGYSGEWWIRPGLLYKQGEIESDALNAALNQ